MGTLPCSLPRIMLEPFPERRSFAFPTCLSLWTARTMLGLGMPACVLRARKRLHCLEPRLPHLRRRAEHTSAQSVAAYSKCWTTPGRAAVVRGSCWCLGLKSGFYPPLFAMASQRRQPEFGPGARVASGSRTLGGGRWVVDRGLRHRSITSSRPCGSGADRFNDFWRE